MQTLKSLKLQGCATLLGALAFVFLNSCLNSPGYIVGPYHAELYKEHTYSYDGNPVQDPGAMHWRVTEGDLITEYDAEFITHTFQGTAENARVELYLVNKKGEQKGISISIDVEIIPWEYEIVVHDKDGFTIEGLEVQIFQDLACLKSNQSNNCLIESQTSNWRGAAYFSQLIPGNDYVVYARRSRYESNINSTNNYAGMQFTANFLPSDSAMNIWLYPTLRSFFGFDGQFELSKVFNASGTDITSVSSSCVLDNFLRFDPSFNWRHSESSDSCSTDKGLTGQYSNINYSGGFIRLPLTSVSSNSNISVINMFINSDNMITLESLESNQEFSYQFVRLIN